MEDRISYMKILEMATFLKKEVSSMPKIGIICGSDLLPVMDIIEGRTEIKYKDIPYFPKPAGACASDLLVFGSIASIPVVLLTGRFYFYEGFSLNIVTMPVRLFKVLGCTELIICNTAHSVNPKYKLGDIVLLRDHLDFVGIPGSNPLRGPNEIRIGERFVSMNNCYDKEVLKQVRKTAEEELGWGKKVHNGVYAYISGPTSETVAEANLLNILGADVVGMSSVPEVIEARHCDLYVFGLSLVIVEARLEYIMYRELSRREISNVVEEAIPKLQELLVKVVQFMGVKRPCICIRKSDLKKK